MQHFSRTLVFMLLQHLFFLTSLFWMLQSVASTTWPSLAKFCLGFPCSSLTPTPRLPPHSMAQAFLHFRVHCSCQVKAHNKPSSGHFAFLPKKKPTSSTLADLRDLSRGRPLKAGLLPISPAPFPGRCHSGPCPGTAAQLQPGAICWDPTPRCCPLHPGGTSRPGSPVS